ncbi:MAG: hypothetical protein U0Q15_01805 [Kineosporiaceae bacterium]
MSVVTAPAPRPQAAAPEAGPSRLARLPVVRSALAAWTTLRRPGLLWGTLGASAAVAGLLTTVIMTNVTDEPAVTRGPRPPGAGLTTSALEASDGLTHAIGAASGVVGVIALCVAAAAMAALFSTGTLRNLIVRQPHRVRLLVGTHLAIVTLSLAAVAVAAVVSMALSAVLAPGQGIDTSAWFTADAWGETAVALGQVALAAIGYATLGSALGAMLRASVPAVAVSVAWLLPIENILTNTVDGLGRWMPGQLLTAVASGGNETASFGAALGTVSAYIAVAVAAALWLFARRDIRA